VETLKDVRKCSSWEHCSSQTKHDKKNDSKNKVVSLGEKIRETMDRTSETVQGWSLDEDGFCSSKTKDDKRMKIR
jgi:hypothetical protein